MIRIRVDADLPHLIVLLEDLEIPEPEHWLTEVDAECSWVFDQAPVTAAPTRNVIGHVQIYRSSTLAPGDALVIGRLVVAPRPYAANIACFFLREAVRFAHERACDAVLEPDSAARSPLGLAGRAGFVEQSGDAGALLVHPRPA